MDTDTLRQNVESGVYENQLAFPLRHTFRKTCPTCGLQTTDTVAYITARNSWQAAEDAVRDKFKTDLLDAYGMKTHKDADQFFTLVYRKKPNGLLRVCDEADELIKIVTVQAQSVPLGQTTP